MEAAEIKVMALVASVGSTSGADLSGSGIGTWWHFGPGTRARLDADRSCHTMLAPSMGE